MISQLLAKVDLEESYILSGDKTVASVFSTPADLINKILLPNMFVFAGFIMFALLLGGGLTIVMSGGDPKGSEKGMQTIKTAITGFLIIFAAYWIMQIIEIVTGVKVLKSGV
jgi:hypothetical protein